MNKSLFQKLIILLFALPALACGLLGGEEPTPTPAPTSTPEPPTATAVPPTPTPVPPTNTPEPTATPDITADFVTYESGETGLTLQYPADWSIEDLFFLQLATDEEVIGSPELITEGAAMFFSAGPTDELPNTDPVALVNEAVSQFDLSEDVSIVDGPTPVTIQGQDAAIARIEGTSGDTGQALVGLVAIYINGDRAAVGFGFTPQESEAEYLPIIEAILNSVIVGEPTEVEPETPTDEPPTVDSSTPVAVGDDFTTTLPAGSPLDFVFDGQAGSPLTIAVEPLGEELDLVLEIFDAEQNSLQQIDETFTDDTEDAVFTPPADGQYFLRVTDFFDLSGDVHITITAGGVVAPAGGTPLTAGQLVQGRLDGDAVQYSFTGTAGEASTIFLMPDEDLDATLAILGTDGSELVERVDDGFPGEAEGITYTPAADGEYIVEIDGFGAVEGGFSILLVDNSVAFTAEGVVPEDGEQSYRVCVPANAQLMVFADPEEEFDNVVDLFGPGGGTLIDQTDNGFTGEPEVVIFTEGQANTAEYPVIVTVAGFAGQDGAFSIIITSSSPEGVVIDGC
jgi:hypothetical protein